MKNLIEQVSKEVKARISKIGTATLVKKFTAGEFEVLEERIAAVYYLEKRGMTSVELKVAKQAIIKEAATQGPCSLGKHSSQMTEQEIVDANARQQNKAQEMQQLEQEALTFVKERLGSGKKTAKSSKDKVVSEDVSATKKVVKETTAPIMKLTKQEFELFELIKSKRSEQEDSGNAKFGLIDFKNFEPQIAHFSSLREFKGVLGSLAKKGLVSYTQNSLTVLKAAKDMISGKMPYKQKDKNEQNFFKKVRVKIEIAGKPLEKSAYVRALLRKNASLTFVELNQSLETAGFSKLYHSELQRCKGQIGLDTSKSKE